MSSTTLIRWSGLATMVGGLLWGAYGVMTFALGLTLENLAAGATGGWAFWGAVLLAAFVLILLGLVGLYARQLEAAGTLGFIGFLVAFAGQALAVGDAWLGGFVMPELVQEAPALAQAMLGFQGPPAYLAALGVTYGAHNLGWILFAIATMRARVLPRGGALLLIVGILLGLPGMVAPVFWQITAVVVGAGLTWLGYALWSSTRQTTE